MTKNYKTLIFGIILEVDIYWILLKIIFQNKTEKWFLLNWWLFYIVILVRDVKNNSDLLRVNAQAEFRTLH